MTVSSKNMNRPPDYEAQKDPQKGATRLSGAVAWVDERMDVSGPIKRLLNGPVPLRAQKNILSALGGLTFISLLIQFMSGYLMAFYYAPTVQNAYNSVDYITYQLPLGWLIRGIHVYNASAIFILVFFHMLRTFFTSSYQKPNEIRWLSGVFLFLLTILFAFTGALLPWDQHGYWATIVGSEIAGAVPFIGEPLMRLIRGGAQLGQLSLTRFYIMHIVVLPAILVILVGAHLSQLRHGMAPAITKRGQALAGKFVPFFPNRVLVHLSLGLTLLALLTYFSWTEVPFEFPADPTSTDYTPIAKWYFLSLFQLLNYFPGNFEPIGSMLLPGIVVGSMLLLPFLDKSKERRPWHKPVTTGIALFYIAMIILLTVLALNTSHV